MKRHRVRVRLSALINMVAGLYRIVVAVLFTLIVVRRLDPVEYGAYTATLGVANAVNVPAGSWAGWSSRRRILGFESSPRAAFLLGSGYLLISIPAYTALSSLLLGAGSSWEIAVMILVFYVLPSPTSYIGSLMSLAAPEKAGLLGIFFETARLGITYALVAGLGAGVMGAIVGPGAAALISTLLGLVVLQRMGFKSLVAGDLREAAREAVNIIKLSVATLPSMLTSFASQIERALVTLAASSTLPAAFVSVSTVPRNFSFAGSFTPGLYAKLLRSPSGDDVTDILIIYSFVSIMIMTFTAVLSKPFITAFNPAYESGHLLVAMAAVEALVLGYASILETVATGAERADVLGSEITRIVRTPLGKIPMASMLRIFSSIGAGLALEIFLAVSGVKDPVTLAAPLIVSYTISSVPYMLYTYKLARSKIAFRTPLRDMTIFATLSIACSSIPAWLGLHQLVIRSFWIDMAKILPGVIGAVALYTILGIALSKRLRELVILALRRLATALEAQTL